MDIESFRSYCMAKKEVTESFPFNEETLVFKVMNKMFALTNLSQIPRKVNLKCDPQRAIELREEYDGLIIPGYHMNKKLWNTVQMDEVLPSQLIIDLIDHSYDLVIQSLPKKVLHEYNKL